MKLNNIYGCCALRIGFKITVIVLLLVTGASAAEITVCKTGICDYSTIQAAISAASPGDIIMVHSGTYYENVDVNQPLILKGIDTGGGKPVVLDFIGGPRITLSAGNSTFEGFSLRGMPGVINVNSNNNIIRNDDTCSIDLESSNNNMLADNVATCSWTAIILDSSSNNILFNNTAESVNDWGISLHSSSNNNTLSWNKVVGVVSGIELSSASNNTLSWNTVTGIAGPGIELTSSGYNTLNGNKVSRFSSTSSTISISLSSSSNNIIYNNDFSGTARDNGYNKWNITKTYGENIIGGSWLGGNFWSDYAGKDTDGDGLGNTLLPYNSSGDITNGGDYLPVVVATIPPSPAPELPTIALMGIGIFGLMFIKRGK
ncbi:Cell surface glycoprotein [uncultured archaeon]|nr:Cell surface glycoprotein [uncultured archaeon]